MVFLLAFWHSWQFKQEFIQELYLDLDFFYLNFSQLFVDSLWADEIIEPKSNKKYIF